MATIKKFFKKIKSSELWLDLIASFLRFLIKRNPIGIFRKDFNLKHPYWAASVTAVIFLGILSVSMWAIFSWTHGVKAGWYDETWRFRKQLYFNNLAQSSTLSDFPVMIRLGSDNFDFANAKNDGSDLRFTDSDGTTLLDYEIEKYDKNSQEAIAWVKVPAINGSSTTDSIFVYWGNSSASDAQDKDGSWSNAYKGVYHFKENDANNVFADSSGNSNDLQTLEDSSKSHDEDGKIGGSLYSTDWPNDLPNPAGATSEASPSVKLDSNNFPVIALQDYTNLDLVLIHCNDRECKGNDESVVVLDSSGSTGYYPSLQIDSAGNPIIAYYDSSSGDLNIIHCNDANCSGGDEIIQVPDSSGTTGSYPFMLLDSNGYPVVAYYDNTATDVNLLHCNDAACAGGDDSIQIIEGASGTFGNYQGGISFVLDSNGYPVISYRDGTNTDLKVAHCNDANCSGSDENIVTVVSSANDVGAMNSIKLDSNGYPMIAYYDSTIADLLFVHCTDVNCSSAVTPKTLTTSSYAYPWMEINTDGNPIIITGGGTYPRLFLCSDNDCTTDYENNLTSYNQYGASVPTMDLDSDGYPVIATYSRNRSNRFYEVDIYTTNPRVKRAYDGDFDFGTGNFTASMWFKTDREVQNNYLLTRYDSDQGYKVWLDFGGHPCFGIDDDSSYGPDDKACTINSNSVNDVDNGQATNVSDLSMTLDSSGYPVIAYFDSDSGQYNLEIVHCNDANCSGGNENKYQVDTVGDVGRTPSIKLDANGYPVIAYHDNTNNDLKIAHCGDANCSSGNVISTVDSTNDVGDYPALEIDSNGYPVVGYYDATNTAVKLAHCNDANCSGGDENIVTVDNTEDDRPYYSTTWMKLDSSGYPVMAYYNASTTDLKITHCNDVNCSGGNESITSPDTTNTTGRYASLELDSNGYPVVAYYNSSDWLLKLMKCNDANCSGSNETINNVVTDKDVGYYYVDLELGQNDIPKILSTSNAVFSQVLIVCGNSTCSSGNTSSFIRQDSYNYMYGSLELDANDYPVVATAKSGNDLTLIHFDNATSYTDQNAFDDQQWHHLVAVKNGTSSIKLFIDGSEVASDSSIAATGTMTSDSAELHIGENLLAIGNYKYWVDSFGGQIDEVQIDNTARSADWIAAQYLSENDEYINPGVMEESPNANEPVVYWKFDEGTGTTLQDQTKNDLDATANGLSWKNESDCVSGKCLFSSGTSYFTKSDDARLDFGTGSFTISFWGKPLDYTYPKSFFPMNKGNTCYTAGNPGWCMDSYVSTGVRISYNDGTNLVNDNLDFNVGSRPPDLVNKWSHIVYVFDKADNRIYAYINGVKQTDSINIASVTGPVSNASGLSIGTSAGWGTHGYIDEFKIYPFARGADQIKMDYESGTAGSNTAEGTATAFGGKSDKWLSDGLVGYWKMDEASWNGTAGEVKDASGNNNNGVRSGDATTGVGKFGSGGTFDGTADNVSVSNEVLSVSNIRSSGVTYSAWVKPNVVNSAQVVFGQRPTTGYSDQASGGINIKSDGSARMVAYDDGIAYKYADSGASSLIAGRWYLLTGTYDPSSKKMRIYINGQLAGESGVITTFSYLATNSFNGMSRKSSNDSNNEFNGLIDEARVYNRALSPEEIRKLYEYAPGPVAYYKFDEKTGTTFSDSSGNGGPGGILTNNPAWVTGKYGSGLGFASNYATITDNASMRPGVGDFTVGFWVKTPFSAIGGSGSWPNIILKGLTTSAPSGTWGFLGNSNSTNRINFSQSSDAGGSFDVSLSTAALSDGWHYITTRRSGATTQLYADGVFVGEDTTAGSNLNSAANFYVGGNTADTTYFSGNIDEIKYYNYARTIDQIIEDMNGGGNDADAGGSTIEPLAYWKLDESSGTAINDSSGHGYNLTRYNAAAVYNNGKINKAVDFDGSNDHLGSGSISDPFEYAGGNMSLSMWVNKDSGEADGGNIVCKPWNGSGQYNYCISATSGGNVGVSLVGATTWSTSASNVLTNGTWSHLVATIDGTTKAVKIYKDGVLVKSDIHNISNWTPSSGDGNVAFSIGTLYPYGEGWAGNTSLSFDGKIDEVKFYNTLLSEDEIKADFNQGKSAIMSMAGMTIGGGPDGSATAEYCVPGDATSCSAPIGEWKFDEKQATTVSDSSGSGNNATLTNGPTWTTGKFGSAAQFDGGDDLALLTSTINLNGNANWTASAWVKTGSASTNSVLSNNNGGPVANDMRVATSKISYSHYSGSWLYEYGTSNIADNKWHYLTWVNHSNQTIDLYVDGKAENMGANSAQSNGPINSIGRNWNSSFNGAIDNVRIYNYSRTPAQIAYEYNRGGPIGWWKFDECQGNTANDSSGNGNNGTITIGATGTQTGLGTCTNSGTAWGNGTNGKFNGSLNFDGTDDYGTVDLRSQNLTKSQTISAWVKTSGPPGGQAHQTVLATDPNYQYGIKLMNYKNNARVGLWLGTGSTNYEAFVSKDVNDGQWHFIAGAYDYDAGSVRIYVDGVSYPSINSGQMLINVSNTGYIGRDYHSIGNNYSFNGTIDDIRVYNYPLTAAQIKNIMNEGSALRFGQ